MPASSHGGTAEHWKDQQQCEPATRYTVRCTEESVPVHATFSAIFPLFLRSHETSHWADVPRRSSQDRTSHGLPWPERQIVTFPAPRESCPPETSTQAQEGILRKTGGPERRLSIPDRLQPQWLAKNELVTSSSLRPPPVWSLVRKWSQLLRSLKARMGAHGQQLSTRTRNKSERVKVNFRSMNHAFYVDEMGWRRRSSFAYRSSWTDAMRILRPRRDGWLGWARRYAKCQSIDIWSAYDSWHHLRLLLWCQACINFLKF